MKDCETHARPSGLSKALRLITAFLTVFVFISVCVGMGGGCDGVGLGFLAASVPAVLFGMSCVTRVA